MTRKPSRAVRKTPPGTMTGNGAAADEVMKMRPAIAADYHTFLTELKQKIASARLGAARAVNRELIRLYWDIGSGIVEKQEALGWGESVVEMLAEDLQRTFPGMRGFSTANLWAMRRLFLEYNRDHILQQLAEESKSAKPSRFADLTTSKRGDADRPSDNPVGGSAILQQLVEEVPWGHHLLLLDKVKEPAARLYYLRATASFGWSRNVLLNQLKAGAYERSLVDGKAHNFQLALPSHLAEQAEEALKSSYNLEFLGIGREVRERELENRLLARLREFILELGYGFCFIGNQHRLTLGAKEYFIDLLFYHRFLKSLVAVELKIGSFEPEFAGKMDFYLNLLNAKEKASDDWPSIGIILCAEKDNLEVEFSLKTKTNPIGVAEYRLVPKLPKELKGKLPTERQLSVALKGAIRENNRRKHRA